ncbi:hypothetical protein SELMODRAFT_432643, partial [Selaginella moellendorffii]
MLCLCMLCRLDYEGIHVVIGSSLFWWDCAGTYTWSKPVMKGTHPSPQDSHSSTAVGSKLYVFGGTDGTSPLNDLFVLDTTTNTWGKPDVFGDVPAPREGHSTSLIGDNLFVFGGCGKSSDPSEEYPSSFKNLDRIRCWRACTSICKRSGQEVLRVDVFRMCFVEARGRLGLEVAPAVVFIKDPGVQPIIVYGKLTRDSFMETVEEYM